MKKMEIVPYDPSWPEKFEREAEKLKSVLGEQYVTIHHIGSTAVPNMQARPIIDIMPIVEQVIAVDELTKEMEQIGYISRGENGIPLHRFYQKSDQTVSFHLHMYEEENAAVEKHLIFRDYLRTNESERNYYGILKECLVKEHPDDRFAYFESKEAFVHTILKKMKFEGLIFVRPRTKSEWDYVKMARNKFYHHLRMSDPQRETLDDSKHVHFILKQGIHPISYVHMLCDLEKKPEIKVMIMEREHHPLRDYFLFFCERWIAQQG